MAGSDGMHDLVVVGGGGSGLAAAVEAASAGARVLLLEKDEKPGGATAWAVGAYTCSATPHQKMAGVEDSPDQHFADMDLVNAGAKRPDNLGLRRLLIYQAPDTLRWLMEMGVEFIGPNLEPPHTRARMHNAIPGAASLTYHLEKRARKLGVTILCSRAVTELVFEDGCVVGAEARGPDGHMEIHRGRHGVILTSGDFAASREMRARYFHESVVNAEPTYKHNTGDLLRIVEGHGGRIVNGDYSNFYIPRMRFVPPAKASWVLRLPPWRSITRMVQLGWKVLPQALMRPFLMRFVTTVLGPEPHLFKQGAALVSPSGSLVPMDLTSPARNLAMTPENKGFIIMDERLAKRFESWPNFVSTAPGIAYAYMRDYRGVRSDIYAQAPTLAALAERLGMDTSALEAAVAEHNAGRPEGERIGTGPYHVLGPARGYLTVTEGGLAVTDDLEVLGPGDKPIPGLFAAGGAGQGGVLLDGHGHHLAWAFVSGRHAAQVALRGANRLAGAGGEVRVPERA
jgi:succinate dehydrogenase/fumarate reductase flavoprotein subunit